MLLFLRQTFICIACAASCLEFVCTYALIAGEVYYTVVLVEFGAEILVEYFFLIGVGAPRNSNIIHASRCYKDKAIKLEKYAYQVILEGSKLARLPH